MAKQENKDDLTGLYLYRFKGLNLISNGKIIKKLNDSYYMAKVNEEDNDICKIFSIQELSNYFLTYKKDDSKRIIKELMNIQNKIKKLNKNRYDTTL